GTGQISYPCGERAVAQCHHVSVYNRSLRDDPLPAGVTAIVCDLAAPAYADLARANYDVVCQFIAFPPDPIARDIDVFAG
ncbi:RNA-binding protein, partial [Rhizobium ruizarguesonis]